MTLNAMISSTSVLFLAPDDVILGCLPLFHVGGLAMLFRAAEYGCELSLHPGFDAGVVNREIDALVALLRSYGIKELVRTGATVMLRGATSIEEALKL